MYSSRGFRDWEIGDCDVLRVGNVYHLFHLIIPNHDYIAHAVSDDGISWKRVRNALFVGEPGEWDDDMLWTMNVTKRNGLWHMFYTGLSRKDAGRIQRIGLAVSEDLLEWKKVRTSPYPISASGPWYETQDYNPRTWISFRDPFFFNSDGKDYLIFCARTRKGALFRRGCAGALRLGEDSVELLPPLYWPRVYDDVECPCLFKLGNFWFLVGSIREDVRVRYWVSDDGPLGPYKAPSENVLFPKGNYATRITYDGEIPLLFSFFILGKDVTGTRVLPPPKQVGVTDSGRLYLRSFYRWDLLVYEKIPLLSLGEPSRVLQNPAAYCERLPDETLRVGSDGAYEIFIWEAPTPHFRWRLSLDVNRVGKLGLIVNADRSGQGYFLTLDVDYGYAQIRVWGADETDVFEDYRFENLQANHFPPHLPLDIEMLVYGNYLELSVEGRIVLSLMDYEYNGRGFGVFSTNSELTLSYSLIELLREPNEEYSG